MAYSDQSHVAANCRNILNGGSEFTNDTNPTLEQVNFWLSSACNIIEARLSNSGYDVPVPVTSGVYSWVGNINTLYAVARAEISRSTATVSPQERTRGDVFMKMFWEELGTLSRSDLGSMGLSRRNDATVYTGGKSTAVKDANYNDTGITQPRFRRNKLFQSG
jgi:hypothetical protein